MEKTTDIRFLPAITSMHSALEPHREWIEASVGCPLQDTVTLEFPAPFVRMMMECFFDGIPLVQPYLTEKLKEPRLTHWEIPPNCSPRIELELSKNDSTVSCQNSHVWLPEWKESPAAVWLSGLKYGIVSANVPYVSFQGGLHSAAKPWLIINRRELPQVLEILKGLRLQDIIKYISVAGGEQIRLQDDSYQWDNLILSPTQTRMLKDDFESFLKQEDWFRKRRLPYRRGYLLYGPPGNGKTSAIRIMSSHPKITAFSLNFSNPEMNGNSLSQVFRDAGHWAPSLVIFEDLDRLFGKEEGIENNTQITLQQLLNCLDGIHNEEGVIVVATANDPRELEPAIVKRPGRFDRILQFPLPTTELRRIYLERLTGEVLQLAAIITAAQATENFSFAQIRETYVLAGQLAFARNEDIGTSDLMESIAMVRDTFHDSNRFASCRAVGFSQ